MDIYIKILFVLNILVILFHHGESTSKPLDRSISFLIVTLPVYGRALGWW